MADHINGYALALFDLAQEEKKLSKYKEQAQSIVQALEENEEYISLLDNKSLEVSERQEMVKNAFSKQVDINLLNFLFILVERSKAKVAIPALKKLIKFINEDLQINEGVVYSTQKLTSTEMESVTTKTSKMLGKKLLLVNKLDAELLSGIKIVVGDEVIEDSILSRLEEIKNQLLEREAN